MKAGDPEANVTGVLVCFMSTVAALKSARREGCNLVITHEAPFLPMNATMQGILSPSKGILSPSKGILSPSKDPDDWREWSANRARLAEIEGGALTVVRLHSSLDRWLIYDTIRELLGLPNEAEGEGYGRVYTVEPAPVRAWIERAKAATGVEHVRLIGDRERVVSRIGLAFGGLGLFVNIGFVEGLVKAGAELLIGGESDDYALRYITDTGAAFIETGHSPTENPGLARFADLLREQFPTLKVIYHECPVAGGWS